MDVSASIPFQYKDKKSVYFIGIGGIGMSALARWFKAQNWAVYGSDLVKSAITQELVKEGLKVKIGHKNSHINSRIGLIIYNRAIKTDNPELAAARRLKIPTLPYSKVIGKLTDFYTTVAITGSHGKSTSTALAGLILIAGGLDPTVFVGTILKEFGRRHGGASGKNIRIGKSKYLVLEADDFGAAFLDYSPAISVVTNIDREHLDTYKTLGNAKKAFLKFIARTKNNGALILNNDDKNLHSLHRDIAKIAKRKKLRVIWHALRGKTAKKVRRVIKIPGEHNVSNAVAAYKVGRVLGIPHGKILKAISRYNGAWRRMEYKGKFDGALVYDDYAHHPTEIRASLKGFREQYPKKKIVCVYQPHQGRRLKALFKEFQSAFDDADETLILPVYEVAGRDLRKNAYDSEKLARTIQSQQPKKKLFYLKEPKNLVNALKTLGNNSSKVIIMMGAGDIVNYTKNLIEK
ncbi:MAG: UDP-N-acetylmuramate--L-alanine ligase [Patescibacteria group bacterium]|nr:UDP-N-acetylmuramate--L-alanine ligase [Patescibacteria group bacterium]MDE2015721.1 UDP-N-acetylmuramate--L-alanine ligase [Patescibacteria group bacterium]MDE2226779.1 UDP-N-acetylmuramate--L-alanine ligase [Patescibacteria group bacterium]